MINLNLTDKYNRLDYQLWEPIRFFNSGLASRYINIYYPIKDETERTYPIRPYIQAFDIGYLFVPYLLSGFKIKPRTYLMNTDEMKVTLKEKLESINFEELDNKELHIIQCYTSNLDEITELINETGLFTNVANTKAQDICNKYAEQYNARYNETNMTPVTGMFVKLFKSRVKHLVVVAQNIYDRRADDVYMLAGALPELYPDLKEALPERAKLFYEELVRRSALKHVLNSKAQTLFTDSLNYDTFTMDVDTLLAEQELASIMQARVYNIERRINEVERNASNYLQQYNESLNQHRELQILFKNIEESKDTFLEGYKLTNTLEGIHDMHFDRGTNAIYLTTRTKLADFDPEIVRCMLHNIENPKIRAFFTDVFVEQKYKLYLAAMFRFYLTDRPQFQAPGRMNFDWLKENNAFFNPHYQYFSCIGGYSTELVKTLTAGDLFGFANVAIQATGAINFADSPVINNFINGIERCINHPGMDPHDYNNNDLLLDTKAIEDEEGNLHSFRELYMNGTTVNRAVDLDVRDIFDEDNYDANDDDNNDDYDDNDDDNYEEDEE